MARFAGVTLIRLLAGFLPILCGVSAMAGEPVLLISIDGFRADYLGRGLTPTLSALAADGVQAAMRPSFPSLTFPNHYTLVTGLYPDHHGIIENTMLDPALRHPHFSLSDHLAVTDRGWWDGATPLWVTMQRQGGHAATMFWPGSEADIQGVRPDHWEPYDSKASYGRRVDRVLSWLDLPADQRPQFLTLYFEGVDHAGHHDGPDSAALNDALVAVDGAMTRLLDGLRERGLSDRINLIILADHGMAALSPDRVIHIDDFVPAGDIAILTSGAMMGLWPREGHEAEVDRALLSPKEHMVCRHKQDMPARLHFGHNPRIPTILCLADSGWLVTSHAEMAAYAGSPMRGTHGYDNQAPDMAALFIATGPAFQHHLQHEPFDNVDVYPLMTHILDVRPEPNDGNFDDVKDMLH